MYWQIRHDTLMIFIYSVFVDTYLFYHMMRNTDVPNPILIELE